MIAFAHNFYLTFIVCTKTQNGVKMTSSDKVSYLLANAIMLVMIHSVASLSRIRTEFAYIQEI